MLEILTEHNLQSTLDRHQNVAQGVKIMASVVMSRRQTRQQSVTVDRVGVGLSVRRVMGARVWPPLRR